MSLQNLKALTDQISKAVSQQLDKDNPDEVMGKLMELSALQATSTSTMALAEMVYNQKIMELVEDAQFSKLSATDKKMLFAGRAKQEIYYMTLAERQVKNISYSIEALRTVLSFLKNEINNSKYQAA